MLYVRTTFDLSLVDDNPDGRVSIRVPDLDWERFRLDITNSINAGDLVVRADVVDYVGRKTYSFQAWTSRETYERHLTRVTGVEMRNSIENAGIGVERFETTDYELTDVVNDITNIADGKYIHWRSSDPSIENN